MRLDWHPYNYHLYEKELALREIESLLGPSDVREENGAIFVDKIRSVAAAKRLVYFASLTREGHEPLITAQQTLERVNGNGAGRQSTRYSVHGLHEYKGKFNPQVAKAILNIFGARAGQHAIDPFCGSGTALVECAQLGIRSLGIDINPMAIYVANAKLQSLEIHAADLADATKRIVRSARATSPKSDTSDLRGKYLSQWFTGEILREIETLRIAVNDNVDAPARNVLLAIASNLLRDYSLQDPQDLRIRRRKSPLPSTPFMTAFDKAAHAYCNRLESAQLVIGIRKIHAKVIEGDARQLSQYVGASRFDIGLTSPPYATALPYIDTQRLSLVWLGLVEPSNIAPLEARLVGSREMRGKSKKQLLLALERNDAGLPDEEASF